MNPGVVQPMAGAVQDVGNPTTLSRYAEARACKCQRMIRNLEHFTIHAMMMRTKGGNTRIECDKIKIFNFCTSDQ